METRRPSQLPTIRLHHPAHYGCAAAVGGTKFPKFNTFVKVSPDTSRVNWTPPFATPGATAAVVVVGLAAETAGRTRTEVSPVTLVLEAEVEEGGATGIVEVMATAGAVVDVVRSVEEVVVMASAVVDVVSAKAIEVVVRNAGGIETTVTPTPPLASAGAPATTPGTWLEEDTTGTDCNCVTVDATTWSWVMVWAIV